MHYEGTFEVASKMDKVFEFVTDSKKITTIFPDVESLVIIDDRSATLEAKVGISFIKGTMDVKLNIVEKKPPNYARMTARGTGLSSSVDLEGTFTLEGVEGSGTRVKWVADASIRGLIAGVGSRVVDTVADKYMKQVISSLQANLS